MNSSRLTAVRSNGSSSSGARPAAGQEQDPAPSSPWEVFGARVRQLRSQAGLAPKDVCLREVCPPEMLRVIEDGEASRVMRCTANHLDRELDAGGRLLDAWARALIAAHLASGAPVEDLARQAAQVREFQPGLIPEVLHTEAYAQALAQARRPGGLTYAERDRHRRRSRSVHTGGPELALILNEAALHAVAGDAATTAEQLGHLARFLAEDRVSLQIVPAGVRNHPCPSGPFRLLGFSPHHQLAYLPAPCGPGQLITAPAQVAAYADLYTALAAKALPCDDSADLLARIRADLTEPAPPARPRALPAGAAIPAPSPAPSTGTATPR